MKAATHRKIGCCIGTVIVLSIVAAVFPWSCIESRKADQVFEAEIKRELAAISSTAGVRCELIELRVGDGNDSWCGGVRSAVLLGVGSERRGTTLARTQATDRVLDAG